MRPRTIAAALLLLSAGAGGLTWAQHGSTREATAPATAIVARADVERTVLASGVVEASRLVSVGARTSGRIETLSVALGDRVAEGDVIATIDSTDQENEAKRTQAAMDQVEAQAASQEARIAQLQAEAQRQQDLRARGINAQSDVDAAASALAVAQADLQALQAQRSQAQLALATAQTALDRTRIASPVAGTVVAVVNDEGTTVNATNAAPTLVKIADLDAMHVIASISEADVLSVHPGDAAHVTLPGVPGRTFDATVDSVAPAPASIAKSDDIATDEAVYYEAQLTLPNPDGALRIGMTAEVSIVLDSAEDALSIPLAALDTDGSATEGQVMVWNDRSRAAAPRDVRLGVVNDDAAQVLDGLAEGEKVVLASAPTGTPSTATQASGPPPMGGPMGF